MKVTNWAIALAFLGLVSTACARHAPLHGTELSPPLAAHEFTLTDQYGKPYALADSRGQAVALYFGFTHCADVCPQTLALLGKARERAGLSPAQLRIIMVSVDAKRDTAAAMRGFMHKVGVDATGLTGSPAQLEAVYRAYGIGVKPEKNDVGHTDTVFLIDKQGRIRELLDPQTPLNAVAADLGAIVD